MVLHLLGLSTPDLSGVLEQTDEFFLLGIDADDRVAALEELPAKSWDDRELRVPMRGVSRRQAFSVAL
jgi:hypothetical protein